MSAKIWRPSHEILVATPGLEFLGRVVCIHRLKLYKHYDPIRALRGEVPGEEVYDSGPIQNLTVTAGKNIILDRLFGNSGPPGAVNSQGIGTDSTAASAGQTQLNPSVSGSVYLQAFDSAIRSSQTVTCTTTIATGNGNFTINEAGMFNGTTNGTSIMLNRLIIGSPPTKTSAMSLVYVGTYLQN